jgi:hypothetical protein
VLVITIVSTIAALAFAWLAWRVRARERRRSEARVALLSRAIHEGNDFAYEMQPGHEVETSHSLFAPEHSTAAKGAPVIKLAVVVAMSVVLLVVVAMGNRGTTEDGTDETTTASAESNPQAALLELVSMRHDREGKALKVTGLVRNPREGTKVTRVTAVVFAFDRAGAFVANGSAGLDFTTLDPGDESPFVVTITGAGDIGRYRVSFRTEAGTLRHVDRRAEQMRVASAGPGTTERVR